MAVKCLSPWSTQRPESTKDIYYCTNPLKGQGGVSVSSPGPFPITAFQPGLHVPEKQQTHMRPPQWPSCKCQKANWTLKQSKHAVASALWEWWMDRCSGLCMFTAVLFLQSCAHTQLARSFCWLDKKVQSGCSVGGIKKKKSEHCVSQW